MPRRALSNLNTWEAQRVPPSRGSMDPLELYCPDLVGHVSVCIMDELLVWGGYHERDLGEIYNDNTVVWNYSLDLDRWYCFRPSGQPPTHKSGSFSAVIWPHWYILGGYCNPDRSNILVSFHNGGHTNDVVRLNLLTCTWEHMVFLESVDKIISPRDKAVSWAYNNSLYVFGGYGPNPAFFLYDKENDDYSHEFDNTLIGWNNQVLRFDTSAAQSSQWYLVPTKGPKPVSRAAHSAVLVGDAVFIFGGRTLQERLSDLHRFNLIDHSWSGELQCNGEQPEGRSWHTMTGLTKTELILYGGYTTNGRPLDDMWHLNLETLSWSVLREHTGMPRLWHTACANSLGDILIFGGCMSNICNTTIYMQTSDKVLTIRRQPYSLQRLCLHKVFKERKITHGGWRELPRDLQDFLYERACNYDNPDHRFYRMVASGLMGPDPGQLSVLQPTDPLLVQQERDIQEIFSLMLRPENDSALSPR